MTRNFSEILLRTRKELETTIPVVPAVPRVFAFSMQAEQSIVVDPKSPGGINSPHGLILFDGVCVLCSRGCRFVSKRDRSRECRTLSRVGLAGLSIWRVERDVPRD